MRKKFEIKLSNTTRKIIAIYYAVGLWKTNNGIGYVPQFLYFIFFMAFNLSTSIGACTSDDKYNIVFLAVLVLIGTTQVYRMYFVFLKQNRFLDLMHVICVSDCNDYLFFRYAENKLKKFMTIVTCYIGGSYSLCVAVAGLPLVKKKLIFDIAFPWDYKTNEIAFWMAYALVAGVYTLSITLVLFTSIMWYMMMGFVVKYEILGNELKYLGHRKNGGESPESLVNYVAKENEYLQDLIVAIESLTNINGLLDEFSTFFSSLFLFQVITSSTCICGTVFCLAYSNHENLLSDAFYFVELVYCLFDVFIVLYLGNEILLSTDRLSYSLFQSNWVVQSESCKKDILIVAERLKQPKELIVGKLFALDLHTFTWIVNRSFSMFSVLQNFRK